MGGPPLRNARKDERLIPMVVTCSGCSSNYKVNESSISGSHARFKCKKCGNLIEFEVDAGPSTVEELKGEVKKKIVVADDTAFFRIMLKDLLEAEGYEVVTANDGEDALIKIKHELPQLDLVLLDMLMPKMDGFQVISEVKKGVMGQSLPILALSGVFKSDSDREHMKELGILGYIDKDTPTEEIVRRVNMILGENS